MSLHSSHNDRGIILVFSCLTSILWVLYIFQIQPVHGKQEKLTDIEKDILFQKSFRKSRIVPDVIKNIPWDELEVEFDNGSVNLGNTLVVHQLWRPPSDVWWPRIVGAFYTFLFLAPDHPDPANPRFREYVLWFVVNVRDGNFRDGDIFAEYIMPPPPEKIGRQRYVFLVFQQKPTGRQKIEGDYIPPIPEDRARANFSTKKFISKYDLNEIPAAGNFFYINWGISI